MKCDVRWFCRLWTTRLGNNTKRSFKISCTSLAAISVVCSLVLDQVKMLPSLLDCLYKIVSKLLHIEFILHRISLEEMYHYCILQWGNCFAGIASINQCEVWWSLHVAADSSNKHKRWCMLKHGTQPDYSMICTSSRCPIRKKCTHIFLLLCSAGQLYT